MTLLHVSIYRVNWLAPPHECIDQVEFDKREHLQRDCGCALCRMLFARNSQYSSHTIRSVMSFTGEEWTAAMRRYMREYEYEEVEEEEKREYEPFVPTFVRHVGGLDGKCVMNNVKVDKTFSDGLASAAKWRFYYTVKFAEEYQPQMAMKTMLKIASDYEQDILSDPIYDINTLEVDVFLDIPKDKTISGIDKDTLINTVFEQKSIPWRIVDGNKDLERPPWWDDWKGLDTGKLFKVF
jgi:hypothetical protein